MQLWDSFTTDPVVFHDKIYMQRENKRKIFANTSSSLNYCFKEIFEDINWVF